MSYGFEINTALGTKQTTNLRSMRVVSTTSHIVGTTNNSSGTISGPSGWYGAGVNANGIALVNSSTVGYMPPTYWFYNTSGIEWRQFPFTAASNPSPNITITWLRYK